jgi:hypothetical protein
MIGVLGRKMASFARAPLFTKAWFVPAWLLLGLGRLAVLVVPFRKIAPALGTAAGTNALLPLLGPAQRHRALLVGRTVRMAARYAPWQANCFAQAIAASLILRLHNIPYAIFFGLRRASAPGQGPIEAHAWTAAGGVAITGGYGFDSFTVVAVFHTLPTAPSR